MLEKLLDHFGTEMAILHEVPLEKLEQIIPVKTAEMIVKAREGKLSLSAGGGGAVSQLVMHRGLTMVQQSLL